MKQNILLLLFCSIVTLMNGQVAIEKQNINGTSTILDFAGSTVTNSPSDTDTANSKGIILSAVTNTPTFSVVTPTTNNPQNGTFLFDKTLKKARMFSNGNWIDLTDEGTTTNLVSNPSNEVRNGVIMGSSTSEAKGILVLESSNKAMILPHVKNPHTTVKSPYPGMMCYDTVSNSLAIYNGSTWSYWK